ncbi:MAG: tripartite tricarboxylate transporter TctB family protein [Hyphomicrobiaceae bacterium]
MSDNEEALEGDPLVSTRTLEIVTALAFLGAAAVFIYGSIDLGFGWIEGEGPAPGYFPFYIAITMTVASLLNLVYAVIGDNWRLSEAFTTVPAMGRVLTVLAPAILYVAFIGGFSIGPVGIPKLGIYVASAFFIALFMVLFGKESIVKAVLVGIGVPLAFFFMFERWFLVPLPKGPLEALLGLG